MNAHSCLEFDISTVLILQHWQVWGSNDVIKIKQAMGLQVEKSSSMLLVPGQHDKTTLALVLGRNDFEVTSLD